MIRHLLNPGSTALNAIFDRYGRIQGQIGWVGNEILIVALNFSDSERQVPIPFGHAGSWVDVLEGSYDNPQGPYTRRVSDPAVPEYVPIPGSFGRILRLD